MRNSPLLIECSFAPRLDLVVLARVVSQTCLGNRSTRRTIRIAGVTDLLALLVTSDKHRNEIFANPQM